jgi:hypothetical protein
MTLIAQEKAQLWRDLGRGLAGIIMRVLRRTRRNYACRSFRSVMGTVSLSEAHGVGEEMDISTHCFG